MIIIIIIIIIIITFMYSIKIGRKTLNLDEVEVNKKEFHAS